MNPTVPDFVAPELNWLALSPIIAVLGTAVLSVLVLSFLPRGARWPVQVGMTVLGLVAGLVCVGLNWQDALNVAGTIPAGAEGVPVFSLMMDRSTLFLQGALLVLSLVALLVMIERTGGDEPFTPSGAALPGSDYERDARSAGINLAEVFSLLLFAVGGMLAFIAAGDLLTMFVALEVFSLPLYIMCGLAARRRLISQEASLKYFMLGAFSSTIFLFGVALLFVIAGSVNFQAIFSAYMRFGESTVAGNELPILLVIAPMMVLIGLLFKVGAAPFHAWTPDVYEGAPTSVTGFMAACTKIAAFGALLRVMQMFVVMSPVFAKGLAAVAVLSMVIGVTVAVNQSTIKRMLAYSSIAHAGFILTAFVVVSVDSMQAVLFYLVAYGFTTVSTFALVSLVRVRSTDGAVTGEARTLDQWRGLAHRAPVLAGTYAFLMLATAGIPLTSGFIGKFEVFSAAVSAGYWWLALVGVLASALAAFFYVRIIMVMYSREDAGNAVSIAGARPLATAAVAVGAIATVVFGVYPSALMGVTDSVAEQSLTANLTSQ